VAVHRGDRVEPEEAPTPQPAERESVGADAELRGHGAESHGPPRQHHARPLEGARFELPHEEESQDEKRQGQETEVQAEARVDQHPRRSVERCHRVRVVEAEDLQQHARIPGVAHP
jgi:hypothetical protein